MITIKKIAQLSECSISTVSKALNDYEDISLSTKKKIINIAKSNGYIPNSTAQSLVRQKSNTIGVVYEINEGLKSMFFTLVLNAFRDNMEIAGYDLLLLSNHSSKGHDYLQQSQFKQVDGILLIAAGRNIKAIHNLDGFHIPTVFIDPPIQTIHQLSSDFHQGIDEACTYLSQLGHCKIGFIQGDTSNLIENERLQGYIKSMQTNKLELFYIDNIQNVYFNQSEGFETARLLFQKFGLLDAIIASSDLLAIGAMEFYIKSGYNIPDDISIIGFDNLSICEIVRPKLTSISQDYKKIGEEASKMLLGLIEGNNIVSDSVTVKTKLVIRDSTKRKRY